MIKYWGKRDEKLFLPTKSSISITLPTLLRTHTSLSISPINCNVITLNNQPVPAHSYKNIVTFLNFFRSSFGITDFFEIKSENSFPTAAGLASSASGFAALTKALNEFYSLNLSDKELSILARHGSGSACRSIYDGFVLWNKGEKADGSDSYAKQLFDEHHWPEFCMFVVIVNDTQKKVSSRSGMQQTVATSPFYKQWIEKSEQRIPLMIKAIKNKDFQTVGSLAEKDCLDMHHCMNTSNPLINYWTNETTQIMKLIKKIRKNGISCYFTIDAGPNVKIICLKQNKEKILQSLKQNTHFSYLIP